MARTVKNPTEEIDYAVLNLVHEYAGEECEILHVWNEDGPGEFEVYLITARVQTKTGPDPKDEREQREHIRFLRVFPLGAGGDSPDWRCSVDGGAHV